MRSTILTTTPAASVGALPEVVIATDSGGLSTDLGETAPPTTKTSELVGQATGDLGQALIDPKKDELLVHSCRRIAQLLRVRVGGERPLADVAHPQNAATHLVPAARCLATATRDHAADMHPSRVDPEEVDASVARLLTARELHQIFSPIVDTLDLVICNEEQHLDGIVRGGYRRVESQLGYDRVLRDALEPTRDYLTLNAQRAANTKRKNAAFAPPAPEPLVVVSPPPVVAGPAPTPAPVPAMTPVPFVVHSAAPASAPKHRARRSARRR